MFILQILVLSKFINVLLFVVIIMETNIENLLMKAESGDIQAQYELALYYMDEMEEMEENGEPVFEAMYWLGKV